MGSSTYNYKFLSIPLGWHTIRLFLYSFVLNGSLVFLFRLVASDRVPPFLLIYQAFTAVPLSTYFNKIPFFKYRDERDGGRRQKAS